MPTLCLQSVFLRTSLQSTGVFLQFCLLITTGALKIASLRGPCQGIRDCLVCVCVCVCLCVYVVCDADVLVETFSSCFCFPPFLTLVHTFTNTRRWQVISCGHSCAKRTNKRIKACIFSWLRCADNTVLLNY